jgi:hypothetical protein
MNHLSDIIKIMRQTVVSRHENSFIRFLVIIIAACGHISNSCRGQSKSDFLMQASVPKIIEFVKKKELPLFNVKDRLSRHRRLFNELRLSVPASDEEVRQIVALLDDEDSEIRDAGAIWISSCDSRKVKFAIPKLQDLMIKEVRRNDESVRHENFYAIALCRIGEAAHAWLQDEYSKGTEDMRITIINALTSLRKDALENAGYIRIIPSLIDDILKTPVPDNPKAFGWPSNIEISIQLLVKFDDYAKELLQESIRMSLHPNRLAMAEALFMNDRKNKTALNLMFEFMNCQMTDFYRKWSVFMISTYADKNDFDPQRVKELANALNDSSASVRFDVILTLFDIIQAHPERAKPIYLNLQALMRKKELGVSVFAMYSLVRGGFIDDEIMSSLSGFLDSDDSADNWWAIEAAGLIGPRASVVLPKLESILPEYDIESDDYKEIMSVIRKIKPAQK